MKGLIRNAFQSSVTIIQTLLRTWSECRLPQFQEINGFLREMQEWCHNQRLDAVTDRESYSPAVLWKASNPFQNMEWQVEGISIFYWNLYSWVLQCPVPAKVMLSSWKHRTWARFVCTLAGAGIPSMGVGTEHQGWNPSGEEHYRKSGITPGWIPTIAGWNYQKHQKYFSRVKIHWGKVPETHCKAFLAPALQLKEKAHRDM